MKEKILYIFLTMLALLSIPAYTPATIQEDNTKPEDYEEFYTNDSTAFISDIIDRIYTKERMHEIANSITFDEDPADEEGIMTSSEGGISTTGGSSYNVVSEDGDTKVIEWNGQRVEIYTGDYETFDYIDKRLTTYYENGIPFDTFIKNADFYVPGTIKDQNRVKSVTNVFNKLHEYCESVDELKGYEFQGVGFSILNEMGTANPDAIVWNGNTLFEEVAYKVRFDNGKLKAADNGLGNNTVHRYGAYVALFQDVYDKMNDKGAQTLINNLSSKVCNINVGNGGQYNKTLLEIYKAKFNCDEQTLAQYIFKVIGSGNPEIAGKEIFADCIKRYPNGKLTKADFYKKLGYTFSNATNMSDEYNEESCVVDSANLLLALTLGDSQNVYASYINTNIVYLNCVAETLRKQGLKFSDLNKNQRIPCIVYTPLAHAGSGSVFTKINFSELRNKTFSEAYKTWTSGLVVTGHNPAKKALLAGGVCQVKYMTEINFKANNSIQSCAVDSYGSSTWASTAMLLIKIQGNGG